MFMNHDVSNFFINRFHIVNACVMCTLPSCVFVYVQFNTLIMKSVHVDTVEIGIGFVYSSISPCGLCGRTAGRRTFIQCGRGC